MARRVCLSMIQSIGQLRSAVRTPVDRLAGTAVGSSIRGVGGEKRRHGLAVCQRSPDVEEHVCLLPESASEGSWGDCTC